MIGFNGTGLMLQPTTFSWTPPEMLGITGDGHGVYPSLQECQLVFNLTSHQEWYELLTYFNSIQMTGTIIATLPDPTSPVFGYRNFSGVILRRPESQEYFNEQYFMEVRVTALVRV